MFTRLAPPLFVLIWSTGWIVGKIVAQHGDPLTFLCLRYVGALALLAPFAILAGARWPRTRSQWIGALLNGVALHGLYLGGVWWAIAHGVPAGVSALIAALQPVLAALASGPLAGVRLSRAQWFGVAMGVAGVALVLAPKLAAAGGLGGLGVPLAVNVAAMAAVAGATIHQKRALGDIDLRALAPIQYLGALAVTAPVALLTENLRVTMNLETVLALAWSVGGLSIAAILLMLAMINRGEVARVSSLIFLVPPVAVGLAFLFFDERLTLVQFAGMAVAAAGVALVNRAAAPALAEGCIAANADDGKDGAEKTAVSATQARSAVRFPER